MEIAFYSNKCALKDVLRTIRNTKQFCLKRRKQLLEYTERLIGTNDTIMLLHKEIPQQEEGEFIRLVEQWTHLKKESPSEKERCTVCRINCLEIPKTPSPENFSIEDSPQDRKAQEISGIAKKMENLNEKAKFIHSVVTVQNEGIDQSAYNENFSLESTQSHLTHMEDIYRRKKRAQFIRRWLSTLAIFLFFFSIVLIRPFFPR
ncbi:hypothetical protein NEFER03_1359 [Nematocida sp. LUAm3]|nr:hypothetical protein NEFER03_1359 [Nematocida sp. LUAm3]KAI5174019.1 hypothetical protein NEFER02_0486 [Nematocida sp. LUAm2]KAI5177238.1 hypothetical protein NEFER01_0513 [Nematocida sp. LUAm1]